MENYTNQLFRLSFLIGLVILFISMFLDWYSFQTYNSSGNLIASWHYNLFTEWSSPFTDDNIFNEMVKPKELHVPIAISIIFLFVLSIAAYGILFMPLDNSKDLEKQMPFVFINSFVLILSSFYIVIFPIMFLIPNNLYYPFVIFEDLNLEVRFYYLIGIGYFFQLVGFVMVFPYAIFYYITLQKFQTKKHKPSIAINSYIQQYVEELDLDKYIAEENLKLKLK